MSIVRLLSKDDLDNEIYSIDSPIGTILLKTDKEKKYITSLIFSDESVDNFTLTNEGSPNIIKLAKKDIDNYFLGSLKKFTVPIALCVRDFTFDVLNRTLDILYGSTKSYSDISVSLGRVGGYSFRAVGNVMASNSIAIIIPCHRVVAKNGSLTGYRTGLYRKEFLLKLESKNR